ncbi:magnesium-dependent phosphatase-1, partial [Pelagophyceae sp. CCMP2097]
MDGAAPRAPALVVFGLDHTLWKPELSRLKPKAAAGGAAWRPVAGRNVKLYRAARSVLEAVAADAAWRGRVAVSASPQPREAWARDLLGGFAIGTETLEQLCGGPDSARIQLGGGDRVDHFQRLCVATGCSLDDIVVFDGGALHGNRGGNCERLAAIGLVAVHTPFGLTPERWRAGLDAFAS